jgi:hypothetical protein
MNKKCDGSKRSPGALWLWRPLAYAGQDIHPYLDIFLQIEKAQATLPNSSRFVRYGRMAPNMNKPMKSLVTALAFDFSSFTYLPTLQSRPGCYI